MKGPTEKWPLPLQRRITLLLVLLVVVATLLVAPPAALAAEYVVTTTSDSERGSLRTALKQANADSSGNQ